MFALFGMVSLTFADKYELDNNAIDNAFNQAVELSFNNLDMSSLNTLNLDLGLNSEMSMLRGSGGKNWVVAAVFGLFPWRYRHS